MSGIIKPITMMVNATKSGQITDYSIMSLNKQLIKRLNLVKVGNKDMKLVNCPCSQVHNLDIYALLLDEKEEAEPDEEQSTGETSIRKVNVLVEVTDTGEVMDFNVNLGNFTLKKLSATRVTSNTKLTNCSSCAQPFEIVLFYCVIDKDEDEEEEVVEVVEPKVRIKQEVKEEKTDPPESLEEEEEYTEVGMIESEGEQSLFTVEEAQSNDEVLPTTMLNVSLENEKSADNEDVEMVEERLEEDTENIEVQQESQVQEQHWEIMEEQNSQDFTSQEFSRVSNFYFSSLPDSSNEALVPEVAVPTIMSCACSQEFEDALSLLKHKRYCESSKDDQPVCFICQTNFKFWQSLINHVKNIHGTKKYCCQICGARERTKSEYQEHILRHEDSKPFKCQQCTAAFSKKQSLKYHQLKEHDPNFQAFLCEDCPEKKFASQYLLKKHKNEVHCTERPFECNECDKIFKTRAHLKNHMNGVHHRLEVVTDDGTDANYEQVRAFFECEICLKCFTAKSSLTRHKMIHTGLKPFTCGECGKTWRSSEDLRTHMRVHNHERPYNCGVCSKSYKDRASMNKHLLVHFNFTEEKEKINES